MKRWFRRLVAFATFVAVVWVVWSWLTRDQETAYEHDRPLASAA